MAGTFKLIYSQSFTSTTSVVVTHSQNVEFFKIKVIIDGISREDLISSIIPTPSDPTNEFTLNLIGSQTGIVQVFLTDFTAASDVPISGKLLTTQKDDVDVVVDTKTFNFEGNVSVVDEGSGKATITVTGAGIDTQHLTFGASSDQNITTALLNVTGESNIGYKMPGAGSIKSLGILTDSANSKEYSILKNGSTIHTTTFTSEAEKTVTGLSLAYAQDDIIQAKISDQTTDIDNPYTEDANTLFLAHFDSDTIASRHITNSSTVAKGISCRNHGATLGASGKFDKAASFNGYNDYLEVLHHKDFDIQDLTLEFWFLADTLSGTDMMFCKDSSGYDTGGHFYIRRNGSDIEFRSQSSSSSKSSSLGVSISTATWYHLAVVLGTGGIKIFLDGNLEYSDGTWTQGWDGNREAIAVGADSSGGGNGVLSSLSNYWDGKICEMRISNTRRYESNFTPSATQFTTDANTIALWHFDETSGNIIYDSSDTIHGAMIQANGSYPSLSSSTKKFGAYSIKMNNSKNDWLRFIHTADYESSAITVEGWVYKYSGYGCYDDDGVIFQKGDSSTEGGLTVEWLDYGDKLRVKYYGASTSRTITSSYNSFDDNEWNHFAVTLDANNLKLYINGNEVDSEALTTDFQNVWLNNKEDVYFASKKGYADFLQAYLDELRISDTVRTFGSGADTVKKVSLLVEVE